MDGDLNTPLVLRQYLTTVPPTGVGKRSGPPNSPVVYDYTSPQVSGGPSFTGGDPVDANGEIPGSSAGYNNSGILSVGLDLRNDRIQLSTRNTTFPFIWLSSRSTGRSRS